MKPATVSKLVDLNRQFYQTFGREFSDTRRRLQPGVMRVLDGLQGDERILDLGCGNGELARALGRGRHRGAYLGLDFSAALLDAAGRDSPPFPARFIQADLTAAGWDAALDPTSFDFACGFAVLHHIPGAALRLSLLRSTHQLLVPGGPLVLSNWQFLESDRLRARIQPWSAIGLADSDVDPGDYLLDWRAGGRGLRYVHHFGAAELGELAAGAGFKVAHGFLADGAGGRLSLYQEWRPDPA